MIRRPPRSTQSRSSAASDVYKRQHIHRCFGCLEHRREQEIRVVRAELDERRALGDLEWLPGLAAISTHRARPLGRNDHVVGVVLVPADPHRALYAALSLIHISEPTRRTPISYA